MHCLYSGREFQVEHGVTSMVYPTKISAFFNENKGQIVTKFASVLFNTQVKSLKHDGHICTFRTGMLDLLLQHKKVLKIIAGEANMITVALL